MRRLANQVRDYAWGSKTAIPRLLGVEPDGRPQAELWLGAHAGAPSRLLTDGAPAALDAAIAAQPRDLLGEATRRRFAERLPFLLKVLAARYPLSLQVHPDAAQARAGYAAEEAAGVPSGAAERNYVDPYHKPELLLALDPFEALCGFRAPDAAAQDIASVPGQLARDLRVDLAEQDPGSALRAAVTRLLRLPEEDQTGLLDGFLAPCAELAVRGGGPPSLGMVLDLAQRFPGDPGAVVALLLNRVRLMPGEALFLPAGNVHTYLSGVAVEVMASSDNVLRAGLTNKHVDAAELLRIARFEVLPVPYIKPVRGVGGAHYPAGVAEFDLRVLEGGGARTVLGGGFPAIVLALEGTAVLHSGRGADLKLSGGESAFVAAADGPVTIEADRRTVVATVGALH